MTAPTSISLVIGSGSTKAGARGEKTDVETLDKEVLVAPADDLVVDGAADDGALEIELLRQDPEVPVAEAPQPCLGDGRLGVLNVLL
jgi:hypothetical protein